MKYLSLVFLLSLIVGCQGCSGFQRVLVFRRVFVFKNSSEKPILVEKVSGFAKPNLSCGALCPGTLAQMVLRDLRKIPTQCKIIWRYYYDLDFKGIKDTKSKETIIDLSKISTNTARKLIFSFDDKLNWSVSAGDDH